MKVIREIPDLLERFLSSAKPVLGEIQHTISDLIDAAKFPDQLYKMGDKPSGVYLISSKKDDQIIYIGMSTDIEKRIYKHIGPGFTWTRNDGTAKFPNCTLADGRDSWLKNDTKQILQNAEWNITAVVFPDGANVSALIESFLIYMCQPEVNVEGK